jgi:hypothetical protein
MLARMIRVFGSNKLFLPESNYAYKEKVGTADSIHNLLDTLDIIKHTNNTNSALLALDFSKAFDMISHEYIYNFLTFIDCPAEFINFFKVTYTTESALLKGTKLDAFPTKAGIPQGKPSSGWLFLFFSSLTILRLKKSKILKGIPILNSYLENTTSIPNELNQLPVTNCFVDDIQLTCNNEGKSEQID